MATSPKTLMPQTPNVRFGHDLSRIQDENGVDLLLLQNHIGMTVEERLSSLEDRYRQIHELRAGLRR